MDSSEERGGNTTCPGCGMSISGGAAGAHCCNTRYAAKGDPSVVISQPLGLSDMLARQTAIVNEIARLEALDCVRTEAARVSFPRSMRLTLGISIVLFVTGTLLHSGAFCLVGTLAGAGSLVLFLSRWLVEGTGRFAGARRDSARRHDIWRLRNELYELTERIAWMDAEST